MNLRTIAFLVCILFTGTGYSQSIELLNRTRTLYFSVSNYENGMTGDEKSRLQYYKSLIPTLALRAAQALKSVEKKINKKLPKKDRINH